MPFIPRLKSFLQNIPYPVGALLSRIPYSIRPGHGALYRQRRREIAAFKAMTDKERQQFIFVRLKFIVEYAWNNVEFYRTHYERQGFRPSLLRGFEDIVRIPLVTKSMLKSWDVEKRSCPVRGRYAVNTGGSSGSTLAFYILPYSIGHEWAHMHDAWSRFGYRQSDLKLGFTGRNMLERPIQYDGLRHQFHVNIYRDFKAVAQRLKPLLHKHDVRYLHGYPSAIYDFACCCERDDQELRDLLRKTLRGVFLGSEYPAPPHREMIESTFTIPSLSFYGHTERAVLASEEEPYVYVPFQTYGFTEAVTDLETGAYKLVGTSYYNMASPLIRYDTADEISVERMSGEMLQAFRIDAGREGDYVLDRNGKRIPLTGLIFGRHHSIFSRASFVQISQSEAGKAVFYVTIRESCLPEKILAEGFDTTGVDIEFSCRILKDPIVTSSGKVLLKVTEQPDKEI